MFGEPSPSRQYGNGNTKRIEIVLPDPENDLDESLVRNITDEEREGSSSTIFQFIPEDDDEFSGPVTEYCRGVNHQISTCFERAFSQVIPEARIGQILLDQDANSLIMYCGNFFKFKRCVDEARIRAETEGDDNMDFAIKRNDPSKRARNGSAGGDIDSETVTVSIAKRIPPNTREKCRLQRMIDPFVKFHSISCLLRNYPWFETTLECFKRVAAGPMPSKCSPPRAVRNVIDAEEEDENSEQRETRLLERHRAYCRYQLGGFNCFFLPAVRRCSPKISRHLSLDLWKQFVHLGHCRVS